MRHLCIVITTPSIASCDEDLFPYPASITVDNARLPLRIGRGNLRCWCASDLFASLGAISDLSLQRLFDVELLPYPPIRPRSRTILVKRFPGLFDSSFLPGRGRFAYWARSGVFGVDSCCCHRAKFGLSCDDAATAVMNAPAHTRSPQPRMARSTEAISQPGRIACSR